MYGSPIPLQLATALTRKKSGGAQYRTELGTATEVENEGSEDSRTSTVGYCGEPNIICSSVMIN